MHIDFKVTVWDRAKLFPRNPGEAQQIIDAVNNREINNSDDLIMYLQEHFPHLEPDFESLVNTEEQLSPEENDGQATIEVFQVDAKGEEHRVASNEELQFTQEKP